MRRITTILVLCLGTLFGHMASALDVGEHEKIQTLIREMAAEHQYDPVYLEQLFSRVELQPKVIAAITRPYERLPWHRYQKIFISDARTRDGVKFWKEHQSILQRAEEEYGIPAAVIVAIIGVETNYGSNLGGYAVIESLSTLALEYPRRSKFFTSELKKFLLLVRDEQLDPFSIKGSYAGAIGIPQFMPSSYRMYAVDFNQSGRRDLVHDVEDAIGSVANYLREHKWSRGGPIVTQIEYNNAAVTPFVSKKYKPVATVGDLTKSGISVQGSHAASTKTSLVKLERADKSYLYRAVFKNFYVITKYNRSLLYAMVVYELSRDIDQLMKNS